MDLTSWIELGDVDGVRQALRDNPAVATAKIAGDDQPLHIACWQKQLAIVEVILAHQPDVNAHGDLGRTPLHYAVHSGDGTAVPIVAILLGHGADPARRDQAGRDVEQAARSELDDDLDEVRRMLRGPRPLAPAVWQPVWKAAKQRPGNVGFRVGPAGEYVTVKPNSRDGHMLETSIEIAGRALQTGFGAALAPADLARFRDQLRAITPRGAALLDAGGVQIEVRADRMVVDHRDAMGRTFHLDVAPTARELADLLRQVDATCAAWSIA